MKKIKTILFLSLCIFLIKSLDGFSQSGKIPPFQMIQGAGKVFKAQNLPMGKPIIIIYFSPDCEECQKFTEGLLKRMNEFRNASLAMVTYLPVEYVNQFVAKYNLNKYSNIYAGTEGSSFFLRSYYGIEKFPFIALYTKNGDLVKTYKEEADIDDISDRLKSL